MSPWLLALLVVVDGTLCGFRAAAGRNPKLFLQSYYLASLGRGAGLSLVVLAVFGGAALLVRPWSPEGFGALLVAADAMVQVYGVYAVVTLSALGLYVIGHFDLGVLATVLVLGPFTLARPFVIIAGAAWAAGSAPHPLSVALCVMSAVVMVSFERLLDVGAPPWRGVLPES